MNPARRVVAMAIAALAAGCSAPTYIDSTVERHDGVLGLNPVIFAVQDAYKTAPPDCISVLPLTVKSPASPQATAEDAAKVRLSLYAHLATQSKRGVHPERIDRVLAEGKGDRMVLAERLKCGTVIEGEVTEYGRTFLGIYSSVTVGADLRMVRLSDGALLWQGKHVAANRGGGIPLDPVGIAMGVVEAVDNIRDEQPLRVTDDLARRLVSTIPDNRIVAQDNPGDTTIAPILPSRDRGSDGEARLQAGDHAGALAAADRAIAADPSNTDAWFLKGRVLLSQRNFDQAEPIMLKAVALDRGDARFLNALGVLNTERGAVDRALAAYRMALDADHANGFAWYNTGVLLFNAGQHAAAAESFVGAAKAYLKAGDYAKTERALNDLRELAATGLPVQREIESIQSALSDQSRRKS